MACRLGGEREGSGAALQPGLRAVLLKAGRVHIHAVLPQLLALAYGDRFSPSEEVVVHDRAQVQAARNLVEELRSADPVVVAATMTLFDFYLTLAWLDPDATREMSAQAVKDKAVPRLADALAKSDEMLKDAKKQDDARVKQGKEPRGVHVNPGVGAKLLKSLTRGEPIAAPVLTIGPSAASGIGAEPPVVLIEGFSKVAENQAAGGRKRNEATFTTAGGVNAPKILQCFGADGRAHKQLVKGKDDLRQDAVMQQVFELANALLQRDAHTRQRRLQVRTYRVVPLAPTAGLLQWAEGTQPVSNYLVNAHERYRPKDIKTQKAREWMAKANKAIVDKKGDTRLETYRTIGRKLKPVMHHFFLERWQQPAAWFERRLAYSRSLAASSMVGFVLGLGDRHGSNILIDQRSAELVHIDLGIAFDQGALLKTPECVPFRLTRDLEDALGVTGVEGVMRGASEQAPLPPSPLAPRA
jgi:ataxia telangiectasia mutated family protein